MLRFDLQQLRARLAKAGRPVEAVVSLESQPGRWLLVRYLIGLTVVGYLYFLEGMFLGILGALELPGVVATFLLPVPYVVLAAARERRAMHRRAVREPSP